MSFETLTGTLLFAIGASGAAASTFLFPLLARRSFLAHKSPASHESPASRGSNTSPALEHTPSTQGLPTSITIIVPAHNEADSLGRTLDTIASAKADLHAHYPNVAVQVLVGADGCTDKTAEVARHHGATCIEFQAQGKWKTLNALLHTANSSKSQGDSKTSHDANDRHTDSPTSGDIQATGDILAMDSSWVVFADSGVLWPQDLLRKVWSLSQDQDIIGFAPSYARHNASPVERLSWWLERQCKSLEHRAGGPISVHGATVAYRTSILTQALSELQKEHDQWLNDDVVIPLMMRTLNPHSKIIYDPRCVVSDPEQPEAAPQRTTTTSAETPGSRLSEQSEPENTLSPCNHLTAEVEFRRRWRMARGNLQWVGTIPWTRHRVVALLALRRIARMMWAYWLSLSALGGALLILSPESYAPWTEVIAIVLLLGVYLGFSCKRTRSQIDRAFQAARVSFLVPWEAWRIFRSRQHGSPSLAVNTTWK